MNLIVNFPASGRQRQKSPTSTGSKFHMSGSRSVQFNDTNYVCFIQPAIESENEIKWNTKQDFKAYRKTLKADVEMAVNRLESNPGEINDDDLIRCAGIEAYLSQPLLNRILKKRERHVRSILEEQLLQKKLNISDELMLRFVSERSSKWFVERATAMAKGYWEIE
ncbi:hypothetical protein ACHAXS_001503 [Conticribra weissflogii]